MRHGTVLLALTGGGTAWLVHLGGAYVLVALGCPRGWPALGWQLAGLTVMCATVAVAIGVLSVRRRRPLPHNAEAPRLLLGVGALLAGLFALLVLGGGLAAVVLPPCRGVGIGGAP
jgi:hypothetical protein